MYAILEITNEIDELLDQAKERSMMAVRYKKEYPQLASVLVNNASSNLDYAEKLHSVATDMISGIKEKATESMKAQWNYEHMRYIEDYNKAKTWLNMYSKM